MNKTLKIFMGTSVCEIILHRNFSCEMHLTQKFPDLRYLQTCTHMHIVKLYAKMNDMEITYCISGQTTREKGNKTLTFVLLFSFLFTGHSYNLLRHRASLQRSQRPAKSRNSLAPLWQLFLPLPNHRCHGGLPSQSGLVPVRGGPSGELRGRPVLCLLSGSSSRGCF